MSKEQKNPVVESESEEFLTVAEVAKLLGVYPSTLYRELWARRLPGIRIGLGRGTWRIPKRQLLEHLRRQAEVHVVREE